MHLFKTSGQNYHNVIKNRMHAFAKYPRGLKKGDLILISKNKADCYEGEKQIQYVMEYKLSRSPGIGEIERLWPGNEGRWDCIVECESVHKIKKSFDLEDVLGYEVYRHYRNAQFPLPLSPQDERKVLDYLDLVGMDRDSASSTALQDETADGDQFNDLPSKSEELPMEPVFDVRTSKKQPTISIEGSGSSESTPDIVTINIGLEILSENYANSLNQLGYQVSRINEVLRDLNIPIGDLKTASFRVNPKYETKELNDFLKGFSATQSLSIQIPIGEELLNSLLTRLVQENLSAKYSLSYGIKDRSHMKTKALREAVKNCFYNASIIADETGLKLGSVLNIHYGQSSSISRQHRFDLNSQMFQQSARVIPEINPQAIQVNQSIEITYALV